MSPDVKTFAVGEIALGGLILCGCYGLYFLGATRVVPPQLDHDMEVQATGFGLLTRLEPLFVWDPPHLYYFAHPPLLHIFVGGSFLLHGSFAELEFYDEASRRARDASRGLPITPPNGLVHLRHNDVAYRVTAVQGTNYRLVPDQGGPSIRVPVGEVEIGRIYNHYGQHPHLLETRTPNLFFASATAALLAVWLVRLTGRHSVALLLTAAYASSPEVFVRSSYGGYFAIGSLATMLMLLAAHRSRRSIARFGHLPFLVGGSAALADHKLVLLPLALVLQSSLRWWREGGQLWTISTLRDPVVAGFVTGTLVFWCYGLAIAPATFVQSHLLGDIIARVIHLGPRPNPGYYPTVQGVWLEFVRHTGYGVLPLSVVLLLRDLYSARRHALTPVARSRKIWLIYVLLTAAAFSVVDWRMTKHLVLLLIPFHLALAPDRTSPAWRVTVPVIAVVLTLVFNVWTLYGLARDFSAFTISPAW